MAFLLKIALRLSLLVTVLVVAGLDATDAYAQSMNCRALANSLSQLDRSGGGFGNQGNLNDQLRQAKADVQRTESKYVRDGCNAAAKRGEKLTPQCQAEAREVLRVRGIRDTLQQKAGTGDAVAQQREAILQDMARYNCNGQQTQQAPRRGNLFDQLFGAFENDGFGDGNATRGDEFSGYAGYETVRTVCVRKVDGYYWPISYSTLKDYAPSDLSSCQDQCPGMDVDLYFYDNPGQEPEQMVNLQGQSYTSLPTAFAYRKAYDPANSCKKQVSYGAVSLVALDDGSNRAMVTYGDLSFPLPMRDPRRPMEVTVLPVAAKQFVDIPLPRPRPAAPGEAPKPVVVQQASAKEDRIVMFGDKRVRIVGPDTPYAPTGAAGT